jgi:hypothetical protein
VIEPARIRHGDTPPRNLLMPRIATPCRRSRGIIAAPALLAIALCVGAAPASAQDAPPYRDDRSTPEAVVQSLYNAINRHEYLRAYSYYGEQGAPADFEDFAAGYADTVAVAILLGAVRSEGAAGSVYYSVPVALDVVSTQDFHTRFAGCYTLRLSNPRGQQTPPFAPLHIERGELREVSGRLLDIVPTTCDGADEPAPPSLPPASEELQWIGSAFEGGAALMLAIPETDHAPLSFTCETDKPLVHLSYEFAPIIAEDGVRVRVLLQAGDIEVPIQTTGSRRLLDDAFVLEGATPLDARFVDLITSRGHLSVFVEDGAEEYALAGAREASRQLTGVCGVAR